MGRATFTAFVTNFSFRAIAAFDFGPGGTETTFGPRSSFFVRFAMVSWLVRVAARLDEEVVDEREGPKGHDNRPDEIEEEDVRKDEVRLEEREERQRDDDQRGQEK